MVIEEPDARLGASGALLKADETRQAKSGAH